MCDQCLLEAYKELAELLEKREAAIQIVKQCDDILQKMQERAINELKKIALRS